MRFFSNYKEILYIQYNLEEKQPEKCDPVKPKKNSFLFGGEMEGLRDMDVSME